MLWDLQDSSWIKSLRSNTWSVSPPQQTRAFSQQASRWNTWFHVPCLIQPLCAFQFLLYSPNLTWKIELRACFCCFCTLCFSSVRMHKLLGQEIRSSASAEGERLFGNCDAECWGEEGRKKLMAFKENTLQRLDAKMDDELQNLHSSGSVL